MLVLGAIAVLTVVSTIYLMNDNSSKSPPTINPEFGNYISAFTSGIVSGESNIRVRLVEEYKEEISLTEPIEMDLFDFSPGLEGDAFWIDNRTIEFRPNEILPSGKIIDAEFNLHKIVAGLANDLEVFKFQFQVIKQSFEVNF